MASGLFEEMNSQFWFLVNRQLHLIKYQTFSGFSPQYKTLPFFRARRESSSAHWIVFCSWICTQDTRAKAAEATRYMADEQCNGIGSSNSKRRCYSWCCQYTSATARVRARKTRRLPDKWEAINCRGPPSCATYFFVDLPDQNGAARPPPDMTGAFKANGGEVKQHQYNFPTDFGKCCLPCTP